MEKTRKPKTAPKVKRPRINPDGQKVWMTDNQHQFGEALLNAKGGSELIDKTQDIYETDRNTARVIINENLKKPNIQQYLGKRGYEAIDTIYQIMKKKKTSEETRLRAAQDLTDRYFGKAVQPSVTQSTSYIEHISKRQQGYEV
jgi:hypothetical protein